MFKFPLLPLDEWQATRDTLQAYVMLMSRVRASLSPAEKHWAHDNTRVSGTGLTTTAVPAGKKAHVASFEMRLDLTTHSFIIETSSGHKFHSQLGGASPAVVYETTLATLQQLGIHPDVDAKLFKKDTTGTYDPVHATRFWQVLSRVHAVFQKFRAGLRQETSQVQFWPDHFDLALLWFSGRLVPEQDPTDPEWSDEQMNFGFSTGDEAMPEPYFYITAYPLPDGLATMSLPEGAVWHTERWQGALMPYEEIVGVARGEEKLLNFLRGVQVEGAKLMLDARG